MHARFVRHVLEQSTLSVAGIQSVDVLLLRRSMHVLEQSTFSVAGIQSVDALLLRRQCRGT